MATTAEQVVIQSLPLDPLGYEDTDLDIALTDYIGILNQSCSYCPGIHGFRFCADCVTEKDRCFLVNVSQRVLADMKLKKLKGECKAWSSARATATG